MSSPENTRQKQNIRMWERKGQERVSLNKAFDTGEHNRTFMLLWYT